MKSQRPERVPPTANSIALETGHAPRAAVHTVAAASRLTHDAGTKSPDSIVLSYFDELPIAMLVASIDGAIRYANSECARMFGYDADTLGGLSVEALVPVRMRAEHAAWREMYMGAPTRRMMGQDRIVTGVRKDGTEFPVEIGLGILSLPEGPQVAATIQDITKRRQMEALLREVNDELAQRNTELDQFVYMASHDLQEPLRKLTSFSQLLPADLGGELPERAATDLKYIVDAAERMRRLVQDLLALSRAGKAAMNIRPISLQTCVNEAIAVLEQLIKENGATLRIPDLPTVPADKFLTTQLFQNLIGNALKFRTKEVAPEIEITIEKGPKGFVFGVKDNGIGIARQHHERVFGAFRRLHSRAEYDGTGIGLSICERAVERQGGRIWVESEPGRGAHFRFTLGGN